MPAASSGGGAAGEEERGGRAAAAQGSACRPAWGSDAGERRTSHNSSGKAINIALSVLSLPSVSIL